MTIGDNITQRAATTDASRLVPRCPGATSPSPIQWPLCCLDGRPCLPSCELGHDRGVTCARLRGERPDEPPAAALDSGGTQAPVPAPADELEQASAARDLLNRLTAERKIVLRSCSLDDGSSVIVDLLKVCRLVPRTVYDEKELP